MTDREKIRRALGPLHASAETVTEVITMTSHQPKRAMKPKRAFSFCLAAALVLALCSVAYAADLGGIKTTVKIWFGGKQTEAEFTAEGGSYTLTFTDENGETHERGGGGVAREDDGTERPLTAGELAETLDDPQVIYGENGTVTVCYLDQVIDITQKFDENGIARLELTAADGRALYMTVEKGAGHFVSSTDYIPVHQSD